MKIKSFLKIFYLFIIIGIVLFYVGFKYINLKPTREIAITIDDLPFVGTITGVSDEFCNNCMTEIANTLVKYKTPAIGFVIGNRLRPGLTPQIKLFQDNGFLLGSHSFSHVHPQQVSVAKYIEDIDNADKILSTIISTPKYYRYPYLSKGRWYERKDIVNYLVSHGYKEAPVTINSRDYIYNQRFLVLMQNKTTFNLNDPNFIRLKKEYLDFVWQQTLNAERKNRWLSIFSNKNNRQILLLHANEWNSVTLDSLINMYENHGYVFISLNRAL